MAILLSRGARLAMDAMATALRGRGFNIIAASEVSIESPPAVEALLVFAAGPPSHIVAEIRQCSLQYPRAEIILIGTDHSNDELLCFIEAGARAFTSSEATLEDLVHTIQSVLRGESPCSGRLGALVASRIATLAKSQHNLSQPGLLTAREQEILKLVAAGLSNKEIGQQLSISLHTVKIHVHRILEKLQVTRRREAARWAMVKASNT